MRTITINRLYLLTIIFLMILSTGKIYGFKTAIDSLTNIDSLSIQDTISTLDSSSTQDIIHDTIDLPDTNLIKEIAADSIIDTISVKDTVKKQGSLEAESDEPVFKIFKELPEGVESDSLFLIDGGFWLADVKKFTSKYVYYTNPGEMDLFKSDRRKFHKVVYKSGMVEIINTRKREIPDIKDWKYILVTENEEEVEHYIKLDKVRAESKQSKVEVSNEILERSAIVVLKKKAAKLDADIILITNKSLYRGYGELPTMLIKGIAYKMN